MHHGQVLLRMGSKGKSPTLAKQVRSLVNFKGGNEMFMFEPTEEESLQEIRDHWQEKSNIKCNKTKARVYTHAITRVTR